jgi:parvulin-like peptidyl-prolyl isomerase
MKEGKLEDSTLIKTVNEYSSAPYNDNFQKPSTLGAAARNALNFLFSSKIGDMSGLITDQDGYKLIKLLGVKEGEDTYVNASHILINFNNDTAGAKKQAEEILGKAKSGQDFGQLAFDLSQDPSAKQNKGDLGWFTKGSMVKEFEEAVFGGTEGAVIGPVKTQFGFHLIKIHAKSKKEFRFAEIKKPVTAGQRTKDIARKKAQEFIADIESGMFIDSLAKHMQVMLFSTPEITKDGFVPGAGQNKNLIDFGLDNKKGKVYGPIRAQGGYGVYMVADKIAEGYKNFDSVKVTMVKPKVQQKKRFAYLMKIAGEMKAKIMGTDLMALQNAYPQVLFGTADSMSVTKPDNRIGLEYPVLDAVNTMNINEISAPIKGLRGVFIVKLLSRTPFNENDYIVKSAELRRQILTTKKQTAVQEWMASIQQRAKIEDNRDKFF